MNKTLIALLTLPLLAAGVVAAANQYLARGPMVAVIEKDPRNSGIDIRAHLQNYVDPTSLVIDLHGISGEHAVADVYHVVAQYAAEQKGRNFKRVILAFHGDERFMLKGEFFKLTGVEFGAQDPMYTLRTFPENVYRMDGVPAFGDSTSNPLGALGVLGKQIQDFGALTKEWFLDDLAKEA